MTGAPIRILVVDDEPPIRKLLRMGLTAHGYEVIDAPNGKAALEALASKPQLVILDLGLPDVDGLDLLRQLRQRDQSLPIVVLSSRGDEAGKVAALDLGADDYVTKPFGMDELLARLRAAVRRSAAAGPEDEPIVKTASFTVDLAAKRVLKDGAEVHLTPTEWGLLEVLARNAGKLVAQKQLLRDVWGPAYERETHYLRVYLAQLRRKLEPEPARPRHLLTEPGMGYRFEL